MVRSALVVFVSMILSLAGCAFSPRPLVFTYEGDDAGLRAATLAAEEWGTTCGASIIVSRNPGGVPMREVDDKPLQMVGAAGATLSNPKDNRPIAIEFVRRAGPLTREVILHELGHALGIRNHSEHGVMSSPVEPGAHVTDIECGQMSAEET